MTSESQVCSVAGGERCSSGIQLLSPSPFHVYQCQPAVTTQSWCKRRLLSDGVRCWWVCLAEVCTKWYATDVNSECSCDWMWNYVRRKWIVSVACLVGVGGIRNRSGLSVLLVWLSICLSMSVTNGLWCFLLRLCKFFHCQSTTRLGILQ
jgi:hypothetical protein